MLGLLTAGVLVIAAVLVYSTFVKDSSAPDSQERQEQRQTAEDYFRDQPFYFCTFGVESLNSPEYTNCVDDAVRRMLSSWEKQGRPDPSNIEVPSS